MEEEALGSRNVKQLMKYALVPNPTNIEFCL
jgi:hypothetical protein